MVTESALGELFLLLVAIYGVECFRWVARGAVVLRAWPFGRYAVEAPWAIAAQFRRLVTPGFPLPPWGVLVAAEALPFRPGPAGLHFPDRHAQGWTRPSVEERFVPWSALATVRFSGLELLVGEQVVHQFGSRRAAAAAVQLLSGWAGLAALSEKQRAAKLKDALEPRFEVALARARVQTWQRQRWPLVVAQVLLFVTLFGGLGWVAFSGARSLPTVRLLVAGVVAWVGCIAVAVLSVRRALTKEARPGVGQWAVTLVSPLALLRAHDLVEGELVGELDPAAVVAALAPAEVAREWLERQRRELTYPLTAGVLAPAPEAVLADDAWLRELLIRKTTRLLQDVGGEETKAPPGLHCPRCLASYAAGTTACSSCPGVGLVGVGAKA